MSTIKDRKVLMSIVLVIVVILVLLFIICSIGCAVKSYKSSPFVSGYTGGYKKYCDSDKDALIKLYECNRDLIMKTRTNKKVDIRDVRKVYVEFVNNCDPSRCPEDVYRKAKEIIAYIDVGVDFSTINTVDFKTVRVYIQNMQRFLRHFLDSVNMISRTVSGTSDPYYEHLANQYVSCNQIDSYETFLKDQCDLHGEIGEQIINDQISSNYLYNNYQDLSKNQDWIDNNTPVGVTALEYKIRDGKAPAFNGNIYEWRRPETDQIYDDPLVDYRDNKDIDMRFPQPGLSGREFDSPSISDYRGRNYVSSC